MMAVPHKVGDEVCDAFYGTGIIVEIQPPIPSMEENGPIYYVKLTSHSMKDKMIECREHHFTIEMI